MLVNEVKTYQQVNRKDFNLTWNAVAEEGSIVVSDKEKIDVNIQFVKQD